jgi:mRNA interferase HigB
MTINNYGKLVEFWNKYTDSKKALELWVRIAQETEWKNIIDVKKSYPSADAVGDCMVFNVKGNNYRLIVAIKYIFQDIDIVNILTHAQYSKNRWKKDCNC